MGPWPASHPPTFKGGGGVVWGPGQPPTHPHWKKFSAGEKLKAENGRPTFREQEGNRHATSVRQGDWVPLGISPVPCATRQYPPLLQPQLSRNKLHPHVWRRKIQPFLIAADLADASAKFGGELLEGGGGGGRNGRGGGGVLLLRNEGQIWYKVPCCCFLAGSGLLMIHWLTTHRDEAHSLFFLLRPR